MQGRFKLLGLLIHLKEGRVTSPSFHQRFLVVSCRRCHSLYCKKSIRPLDDCCSHQRHCVHRCQRGKSSEVFQRRSTHHSRCDDSKRWNRPHQNGKNWHPYETAEHRRRPIWSAIDDGELVQGEIWILQDDLRCPHRLSVHPHHVSYR